MKNRFTSDEIKTIRSLVREKQHASRDRQKVIRSKLRAIGFDISLYAMTYEAFTAADLDRLIEERHLEVAE